MNAPARIEAASPLVYKKIAAVQGALAKIGIGKNRQNNSPGGKYAFRGIDDVYNALAPLLAEHGLCVLPRILARESVERKSNAGNALFYVTVEAEFDFVAAEDGSSHTVRTFGEAMDSSDKATNKAMSAAYKYAAFMAFSIPTEGDNDADSTTHEVAHRDGIADAVLSKIIALCEAIGGNQAALICKAYKVEALPELTAKQGEAVVARLEEKLAERAKEETNAKARENA